MAGNAIADTAQLLRFPYPFKAAVTIASDSHPSEPFNGISSFERFEAIHTLINTRTTIIPGSQTWKLLFSDPAITAQPQWSDGITGFGLPVADSIYLIDKHFGIFESFIDDESKLVRKTQALREEDSLAVSLRWLADGWLDTIHTTGYGPLSNRQATRSALDAVNTTDGNRFEVWSNHSLQNTPANVQPDERGWATLVPRRVATESIALIKGNRDSSYVPKHSLPERLLALPPESPATFLPLHLVMLIAALVLAGSLVLHRTRFIAFKLIVAAVFCAALALLSSHSLPFAQGDNPDSRYYNLDLLRASGIRFYKLLEDKGGYQGANLQQLAVPTFEHANGRRTFLNSITMDDGKIVSVFPRTYLAAAGRRSLELLDARALQELIESEGAAILMTHWLNDAYQVFNAAGLAGLQRLSDAYTKKEIWVAPTQRILNYEYVRTYMDYTIEQTGTELTIDIRSIDPPDREQYVPTPQMLAGISFEIPIDWKPTVKLAGQTMPSEHYQTIATPASRVIRF